MSVERDTIDTTGPGRGGARPGAGRPKMTRPGAETPAPLPPARTAPRVGDVVWFWDLALCSGRRVLTPRPALVLDVARPRDAGTSVGLVVFRPSRPEVETVRDVPAASAPDGEPGSWTWPV